MVKLNAHFDGKAIVLDEPLPRSLPAGARLTIHIETPAPLESRSENAFQPLNIHIPPELSNQIALEREFNIEES